MIGLGLWSECSSDQKSCGLVVGWSTNRFHHGRETSDVYHTNGCDVRSPFPTFVSLSMQLSLMRIGSRYQNRVVMPVHSHRSRVHSCIGHKAAEFVPKHLIFFTYEYE